jgi:hypothetical protein
VVHAGTSATRELDFTVQDCRAQLELILDSADFDVTGRERRFLSHVAEEALSGRGDRIREVFGRSESFDPQANPIVRIGAGHSRECPKWGRDATFAASLAKGPEVALSGPFGPRSCRAVATMLTRAAHQPTGGS